MSYDPVRININQAKTLLQEAVSRGEPRNVAGLYSEHALALPPTGRIYRGREEIEALWATMMRNGLKELSVTPIEIQSHGDMAYEVGQASVEVELDGTSFTESAKYLVVWVSNGGGWKIQQHMWNTSTPPMMESVIC